MEKRKQQNGFFKCPFCGNQHILGGAALRLEKIMKYDDVKTKYDSLITGIDENNKIIEIDGLVTELRNKIDEKIDGFINDLNDYRRQMHQKLVDKANRLKQRNEKIKEFFDYDQMKETILKETKSKLADIKSKLIDMEIKINNASNIEEQSEIINDEINLNHDKIVSYKKKLNEMKALLDKPSLGVSSTSNRLNLTEYLDIDDHGEISIENIRFNKLLANKNFKGINYLCDFELNNHFVITDHMRGCLHIYQRDTFEYVQSTPEKSVSECVGICVVNLVHLCVVDAGRSQLNFIDKNYNIIATKRIEDHQDSFCYLEVEYNYNNHKLYVLDEERRLVLVLKIGSDFELDLQEKIELNTITHNMNLKTKFYAL